jgi:hypothetical protein
VQEAEVSPSNFNFAAKHGQSCHPAAVRRKIEIGTTDHLPPVSRSNFMFMAKEPFFRESPSAAMNMKFEGLTPVPPT